MPFPDEDAPVVLVPSSAAWPAEYDALRSQLRELHLVEMASIEHVGSTSIPGLPAKDVIDVQIRVPHLESDWVKERFAEFGWRHRREEWNNIEMTRTGPVTKLVFAPPAGARRSNIHVRVDGTSGARDTLLFRDFLRVDEAAREMWGDFKRSIADTVGGVDLASYGQRKQPAWDSLMEVADLWASQGNWEPAPLVAWSAQ